MVTPGVEAKCYVKTSSSAISAAKFRPVRLPNPAVFQVGQLGPNATVQTSPLEATKHIGHSLDESRHSDRCAVEKNLHGAMCVRNLCAQCVCNSRYLTQLAAFFIEPRAK